MEECASFEVDPSSEGMIEHIILKDLNKMQNDSTLHSLKWCARVDIHRIYTTKNFNIDPLPLLRELHITHFPMTARKVALITQQATHLRKLTLLIPVGIEEHLSLISDSLEVVIIIPRKSVLRLTIEGEARPTVIGAEKVEYVGRSE